jgi:hypothetical protein
MNEHRAELLHDSALSFDVGGKSRTRCFVSCALNSRDGLLATASDYQHQAVYLDLRSPAGFCRKQWEVQPRLRYPGASLEDHPVEHLLGRSCEPSKSCRSPKGGLSLFDGVVFLVISAVGQFRAAIAFSGLCKKLKFGHFSRSQTARNSHSLSLTTGLL